MRFQDLDSWLRWQESLHPREIELGLERLRPVHARLSSMPPDCRVITVAGTNGKGSCVAVAEAVALASGLRVGAYTSPHLFRYNERVRLDGQPVRRQLADGATYDQSGIETAERLAAILGLDLRILNLGGGFPVAYDGMTATPVEAFADALLPVLAERGVVVAFEPGRFLIGEAGVLLAEVQYIKGIGSTVVLDAGIIGGLIVSLGYSLLLGGVLVAGLLLGRPGHEGLMPSAWVETAVGGNGVAATLFASLAGALMYFATLTEVPILQGLIGAGMGPGPSLALLLAGAWRAIRRSS